MKERPGMQLVRDRRASEAETRRLEVAVQERTLRYVMGSPLGREFVSDLIAHCGLHEETAHTNALVMAGMEGRRNVAVHLIRRLERIVPELVETMNREAHERRAEEKTA